MPILITHRAPLELVFRNLLSHAVKYRTDQCEQLTISGHWQDGNVTFIIAEGLYNPTWISDSEPFQPMDILHIDSDDEGSSLGMAFVIKAVQEFDGQISVGSNAEQGQAYRFTWPASAGAKRVSL